MERVFPFFKGGNGEWEWTYLKNVDTGKTFSIIRPKTEYALWDSITGELIATGEYENLVQRANDLAAREGKTARFRPRHPAFDDMEARQLNEQLRELEALSRANQRAQQELFQRSEAKKPDPLEKAKEDITQILLERKKATDASMAKWRKKWNLPTPPDEYDNHMCALLSSGHETKEMKEERERKAKAEAEMQEHWKRQAEAERQRDEIERRKKEQESRAQSDVFFNGMGLLSTIAAGALAVKEYMEPGFLNGYPGSGYALAALAFGPFAALGWFFGYFAYKDYKQHKT